MGTNTTPMLQPGPCVQGRLPLAALNPDTDICPDCPHAMLIHDESGCYGCGPLVLVWDTESGELIAVPRAEAAAGMVRYARSLGPGSPACGEVERQALQLARGGSPFR